MNAGNLPSVPELRVVLFSGGRGSSVLARQLVSSPAVTLTIAINGYDDGASTGEVRRFLGDSLGPSDFRKNASNLATALRSCPKELIELLDLRLPVEETAAAALERLPQLLGTIPSSHRSLVEERLQRFVDELRRTGRPFNFSDCSVGNLVFAGGFLLCDRDFNRAVDDYCALMGVPEGTIENVTDGTNAYLVAIESDGRLLATEEAIVDASRPNRIKDIFLLDRPLQADERAAIETQGAEAALRQRAPRVRMNPRLAPKIASADLIIYGPGTQHSSLFPSYLTPGLGDAIASNLSAMKLLITNIQPDAEITGSNAMDLVDRAVYYLKAKDTAPIPAPFLITHSLLNDSSMPETTRPYVPLGPTDTIEDPRLVRIGNYEDGVTGRHDAARVLEPFLASIVRRGERYRACILLLETSSLNKITQSLLEMVRGGIADVPLDITVFYAGPEPLASPLTERLPFAVQHVREGEGAFARVAREGGFDYVVLFESSGMYRGEEIVPLLSPLAMGRLDAVWGSRRLSVRDIQESYRLRYSANTLTGAMSSMGSHALSLACLIFYGRYITDTLSGVRAVRAGDALDPAIDLTDKNANHLLLSRLLRRKAEVLEMPVRFVPLSPERVKRTSAFDGLRALTTLIGRRFGPQRGNATPAPYPADSTTPARHLK